MENQRNIIVAIIMAGLILVGWDLAMGYFYPPAPQSVNAPKTAGTDVDGTTAAPPGTADIAADAAATGPRTLTAALQGGARVAIKAPRVSGSINLAGGMVDDLTLTDHRQTIDKSSPPVRLLSPAGTATEQYAQFGWVAPQGVAVPTANTVWTPSAQELAPGKPVTLRWTNAQGVTFAIEYAIDENYMVTATQSVSNRSGAAINGVQPFALIRRTAANADTDSYNVQAGPMGVFADTLDFGTNYSDISEAPGRKVDKAGRVGWMGFTDHYWMSVLIPDAKKAAASATFREAGNNLYRADIIYPRVNIGDGKMASTTTKLFAGAKESQILDAYEDGGISLFGRSIDWGWFWFFERPIFYLLDWLFDLVKNFGVAIICLTLIIRGLMFPIAQKQFASMAAMRALQPKMKAIQERYKDDKQKQQQEVMELYKREKVNPLAGCLPIFLQIPIFFALYKVLVLTVEMRHQPFALWIKDLSAPDPMFFGLTPGLQEMLPAFMAIGILPVLLGFTMWLQFKLQPAAMDPIQQQMFSILPWIMMVFMAPFAAGLQLYWVVSNLLTIAQQKWLYSRHPQLKEQMKKDAEDKARQREQAVK